MIAPELTEKIAEQVEQEGLDESMISRLRQTYTKIHFTYCMDDDINTQASPVLERSNFNIYLVDGRHHCLCLTTDHDVASGLVLAEIIEE